RVETGLDQFLEPVFPLEVRARERDASRVDAGLLQHPAFGRLGLRSVHLEVPYPCVPGPAVGARVEAGAQDDDLADLVAVALGHAVEERLSGGGFVLDRDLPLERVPERPGYVAG